MDWAIVQNPNCSPQNNYGQVNNINVYNITSSSNNNNSSSNNSSPVYYNYPFSYCNQSNYQPNNQPHVNAQNDFDTQQTCNHQHQPYNHNTSCRQSPRSEIFCKSEEEATNIRPGRDAFCCHSAGEGDRHQRVLRNEDCRFSSFLVCAILNN